MKEKIKIEEEKTEGKIDEGRIGAEMIEKMLEIYEIRRLVGLARIVEVIDCGVKIYIDFSHELIKELSLDWNLRLDKEEGKIKGFKKFLIDGKEVTIGVFIC